LSAIFAYIILCEMLHMKLCKWQHWSETTKTAQSIIYIQMNWTFSHQVRKSSFLINLLVTPLSNMQNISVIIRHSFRVRWFIFWWFIFIFFSYLIL